MFRKRRRPTPGFGVPPPFQPVTGEYAPLKAEGVHPYCAMMQIAAEDQYQNYVICRGFDTRIRKFVDYEAGNANKPGISVAKPFRNRVKCYYQVGQVFPAVLPVQGTNNYTPPSPVAVNWRVGQNPGKSSTSCGQPHLLTDSITELTDHNSKYVNWMLLDSGPTFLWVALQEDLYTCGDAAAYIIIVDDYGHWCDGCGYTTITVSDPYAVVPGNALAEGVTPKHIPSGNTALVMAVANVTSTGSASACQWAAVTFGSAECCTAATPSHSPSRTPSHTLSHTVSHTQSPSSSPSATPPPTPSHSPSRTPSHSISHTPSHTISHTPSHTPSASHEPCEGMCAWIWYEDEPQAGGWPHWELYYSTCYPVVPECECNFIGNPELPGPHDGAIVLGRCGPEGSNTPSHTISHTPSHTTSHTPSHTQSASATPSHTPSHTVSHTPSHTPSYTASPSRTPSHTPSHTVSHTPSHTISHTPSHTVSHTPSHTPSHTVSHTPSHTPSHTISHTPSQTASHTPSHTVSHTPSHTPSQTTSHTPSHTKSHTPSHTKSRTPSHTRSHTPSHTISHTPSRTPSPSHTPSHTKSHTPSHTLSHSPSATGEDACTQGQCMWEWLEEDELGYPIEPPYWNLAADTCPTDPTCVCTGEPTRDGDYNHELVHGTCTPDI